MKRSEAVAKEIERPGSAFADRVLREDKGPVRNLLRSAGVVAALPYLMTKDAMATKLSSEDKAQLKRETRRGGKEDDEYGSRKEDKPFKKGGMTSSASKRADGCAVKGKTKGRMV
jgi:hypothetical protein